MKSRIIRAVLSLTLIFGIGAAAVKAASPYKLKIPFDFTVNGKLMKAGNYELKFGVSNSDTRTFLLRSTDGSDAAIVNNFLPLATSNESGAKMVFEKSEDGYKLTKVYTSRVRVELPEGNRSSGKIVRVEINQAK